MIDEIPDQNLPEEIRTLIERAVRRKRKEQLLAQARERQHILLYRYAGSTDNPGGSGCHDKVVLDSCIIAAIFLPETITGKAIETAADNACITVDLACTEVANAAWKRAVHAAHDAETVKASLDDALAFIRETCEVIPVHDHNHSRMGSRNAGTV